MPAPKHSGPDATLKFRLAGSLGITGLLALNGLGLLGLVWSGVVVIAALSVNWAARRSSELEHATDLQRLGSAASVAIETFVWSVPAVLFWGHDDLALRPVALALLLLQIYFAAAFAYREWISLVICGLPPAIVVMALVIADDRVGWTTRMTALLVVAGTIGFALILARINARTLEAMSGLGQRPPSP